MNINELTLQEQMASHLFKMGNSISTLVNIKQDEGAVHTGISPKAGCLQILLIGGCKAINPKCDSLPFCVVFSGKAIYSAVEDVCEQAVALQNLIALPVLLTKKLTFACVAVEFGKVSFCDFKRMEYRELRELKSVAYGFTKDPKYRPSVGVKRLYVCPGSMQEAYDWWENAAGIFRVFYGNYVADIMMEASSQLRSGLRYGFTEEDVMEAFYYCLDHMELAAISAYGAIESAWKKAGLTIPADVTLRQLQFGNSLSTPGANISPPGLQFHLKGGLGKWLDLREININENLRHLAVADFGNKASKLVPKNQKKSFQSKQKKEESSKMVASGLSGEEEELLNQSKKSKLIQHRKKAGVAELVAGPELDSDLKGEKFTDFYKMLKSSEAKIVVDGNRQACLWAVSHRGCKHKDCKHFHTMDKSLLALIQAKVADSPAASFLVARMGGLVDRPKLVRGSEKERKIFCETIEKVYPLLRIRETKAGSLSQLMISNDTDSPPSHWGFSDQVAHAQEGSLKGVMAGKSLLSVSLPRNGILTVYQGEDSTLMKKSRQVVAILHEKCPKILKLKSLNAPWWPHVVNLMSHLWLEEGGDFNLERSLQLAIRSTQDQSGMVSQEETLHVLLDCAGIIPPIKAGSSVMDRGTISKFVDDVARVTMHGKSILVKNLGELVGNRLNSCVLCVVADIMGVEGESLLAQINLEQEVWNAKLLMAGDLINMHQVRQLRFIHDVKNEDGLDCNMLRYLHLEGALVNYCVYVIIFRDFWRVVKFQSQNFNPKDSGSVIGLMCIINNHATRVFSLPDGLGGNLMEDDGQIRSLGAHDALAFEAWLSREQIGIWTAHPVTQEQVVQGLGTISRSNLSYCPCCDEQVFFETSAGRVSRCEGDSSEVEEPSNQSINFQEPLNNSVLQLPFLDPNWCISSNSSKLVKSTLPPSILSRVARNKWADGFTPDSLGILSQDRSLEALKWAVMSIEELKLYDFGVETEKLAMDLLLKVNKDLEHIDRKKMHGEDDVEWQKVLLLLKQVVEVSDGLAVRTRSIRAAMAVFRQAWLRWKGSMRIDAFRISQIRGLLPDAVIDNMMNIAQMGVPMLLLQDRPLPSTQSRPYKSALAAMREIAWAALVDAAQGGVLIFSESSRAIMDESGVVEFSSGAADKKNPDGSLSDKKRHTCDARQLNSDIFSQEADQLLRKNLAPPPAVTPKIMESLRYIARLSAAFPYVPIVACKRDFSNAFKLIHHSLADVVNLATQLPGLEGIMVSSVMVFGWTYSPAWFGLFALAVADAHCQLRCGDPDFNGVVNFFTRTHVDDALSFFLHQGNAELIVPFCYGALSAQVFDDNSISQEKLEVEGEVSMLIKAWGVIWDLRTIRECGPKGAIISIPPEKVKKMKNLLDEVTVKMLVNRQVTMKWHERVQGLAVYMSICCKPLHSILARLFAMAAYSHPKWVSPYEDVDFKWNEYAEAIILLKALCEDEESFSTSCVSSIARALSPREQMDLGVKRIFIGSDATGKSTDGRSGVWAGIDYAAGEWMVAEVEPFMDIIRKRNP